MRKYGDKLIPGLFIATDILFKLVFTWDFGLLAFAGLLILVIEAITN